MTNAIPIIVLKECYLYCFVITISLCTHGNYASDSTDLPINVSDAMIFFNKSSVGNSEGMLFNHSDHWDKEPDYIKKIRNYSKDIFTLNQDKINVENSNETILEQSNKSTTYHNIYFSKNDSNQSSPVDIFGSKIHGVNYDISSFNMNADCVNVTENSPNINCSKTRRKPLYIGGLFDLSGGREESLGRSELTAAKLAIHHVNELHLLPQYELVLLHNDSKVMFINY